jgi:hypothetical protein
LKKKKSLRRLKMATFQSDALVGHVALTIVGSYVDSTQHFFFLPTTKAHIAEFHQNDNGNAGYDSQRGNDKRGGRSNNGRAATDPPIKREENSDEKWDVSKADASLIYSLLFSFLSTSTQEEQAVKGLGIVILL